MKLHISLSSRVWKREVCEAAPVTAAQPKVSSNSADTWSEAANSDTWKNANACFGVRDKEVNTWSCEKNTKNECNGCQADGEL